MSLIKQLWLAVILMISIISVANFTINTISSRNALEQELEIKNEDNATSLALSISHMEKNPVAINLMLSAQFDNGHYDVIQITDPNNQIITKIANTKPLEDTPSWFKKLANIAPAPGIAQIQDGWHQYGTLYLMSSTEFAYNDLWQGVLSMLLWSAIIGLMCGLTASFALKVITRPLDEMVEMTKAIGNKNFTSMKEPNTLEFKSLAKALNALSQRINMMFTNQSQLLDQLRTEANIDEVTGLMNRNYFSSRVSTMTSDHDGFMKGLLITSRINNLAEINEALGSASTDTALKNMGSALLSLCESHPTLIAGRLTGSTFAVFSSTTIDRNAICTQINSTLTEAAGLAGRLKHFSLMTSSSIVRKSQQNTTTIDNNTSTDAIALIHLDSEEGSEAEWATRLSLAIDEKKLSLAFFPVTDIPGNVIHYESSARLQLSPNGPWLAAGEFIASATQLGLMTKLDLLALETAIQTLEKDPSKAIGLNVSAQAMCDLNYLHTITSIMSDRPSVASKLWFEVTEHSAFHHLTEFSAFCKRVKLTGCKVGIEHVGTHIVRLGELHSIDLDYIKIDASIIRGIDHNPGNKAFLKGVCLIAHEMDLITIAEGVQTRQELAALTALGVDAMTGPAIKVA